MIKKTRKIGIIVIIIVLLSTLKVPILTTVVKAEGEHNFSNCSWNKGHPELGDQNGDEYLITPWYNKGWTNVLRYPDPKVGVLISQLATEAANNDYIGYSNYTGDDSRVTFWNELKASDYRPSKIKNNCASDCSGSSATIVRAAGCLLNIEPLKEAYIIGPAGIIGDLEERGFQNLTDSKYTDSPDNLQLGDIVANFDHVVIYIGDGKGSPVSPVPESMFQMTGTKTSDCGGNEFGGAHGGEPGDQTQGEYAIKDWYSFGVCVLRPPDTNMAVTIAKIAIQAANNDAIGYDQDTRTTYWNELEKCNYDPSKITTPCNADCSSSTSANIKAAGFLLNNEDLKSLSEHNSTRELRAELTARGFTLLTDEKYLSGPENLLAGDVILNDGSHVDIFVGNGEGGFTYELDDPVNLDEQNFEFSGTPKSVSYSGRKKPGEWVFSFISQFVDFAVSLITNGIKISIMGWAMTFESAIDSSLKFIEGVK